MFWGYGKVAGYGMGFQKVECVDAIAAVLAFQVGHRRVEGAIGVVVAVNPMESGAPAKDDVVGGVVGGADCEVEAFAAVAGIDGLSVDAVGTWGCQCLSAPDEFLIVADGVVACDIVGFADVDGEYDGTIGAAMVYAMECEGFAFDEGGVVPMEWQFVVADVALCAAVDVAAYGEGEMQDAVATHGIDELEYRVSDVGGERGVVVAECGEFVLGNHKALAVVGGGNAADGER